MADVKKIIIFPNGNVAIFDENGQQIPDLQRSWIDFEYIKKLAQVIAKEDPTVAYDETTSVVMGEFLCQYVKYYKENPKILATGNDSIRCKKCNHMSGLHGISGCAYEAVIAGRDWRCNCHEILFMTIDRINFKNIDPPVSVVGGFDIYELAVCVDCGHMISMHGGGRCKQVIDNGLGGILPKCGCNKINSGPVLCVCGHGVGYHEDMEDGSTKSGCVATEPISLHAAYTHHEECTCKKFTLAEWPKSPIDCAECGHRKSMHHMDLRCLQKVPGMLSHYDGQQCSCQEFTMAEQSESCTNCKHDKDSHSDGYSCYHECDCGIFTTVSQSESATDNCEDCPACRHPSCRVVDGVCNYGGDCGCTFLNAPFTKVLQSESYSQSAQSERSSQSQEPQLPDHSQCKFPHAHIAEALVAHMGNTQELDHRVEPGLSSELIYRILPAGLKFEVAECQVCHRLVELVLSSLLPAIVSSHPTHKAIHQDDSSPPEQLPPL